MKYRLRCDGGDLEFEARTPEQARRKARRLLSEGFDDRRSTEWIDGRLFSRREPNGERVTAKVDPEPPPCVDENGRRFKTHSFSDDHSLVGGLKENPGVWGHGGGVIIVRECVRCHCRTVTDTWAQRRDTGEQGLTSLTYELPEDRGVDPVTLHD